MSPKRWAVLLLTVALLAGLGFGGYVVYEKVRQRLTPERCTVVVDDQTVTLTREQATNASIIVAASVSNGLPERAAIVALVTAYQESGLRNLDYGDRDSVGLFQQRPSQGWGTVEEIMDPWYSSDKFYEALEKIDGWEDVDINDIAQQVQISAYPDAYGKHTANATAVARSLLGEPASISCVNFELADPEPDEFAAVLEAIDADFVVDGDTVTISGDDDEVWSGVNMAMANGYAAGLSRVEVLGKVWTPDKPGWRDAATDSAGAVLTLG